ncbi:MAG: transcriptional regulator, HTH_3 family, partial [uncultured Pseudonocardia sp.]
APSRAPGVPGRPGRRRGDQRADRGFPGARRLRAVGRAGAADRRVLQAPGRGGVLAARLHAAVRTALRHPGAPRDPAGRRTAGRRAHL